MSTTNETGSVRVNGVDLHYETQGRGEPLLWLHGMGGCGRDIRYSGRDDLAAAHQVVAVDARGHGRSTNPGKTFTHRQCALDTIALLDHLGIARCKAIGCSMGGNTLLHVATMQPDRVDAMVLVSPTMYFPEQARAMMRQVRVEARSEEDWGTMREQHRLGDEQIVTLWQQQRALADSYDDVNFTPPCLSRITARTLIVYGDRDVLYPVEMAFQMYRAIPNAALWVIPNAGHAPMFGDAADAFVRASLRFFAGPTATQ